MSCVGLLNLVMITLYETIPFQVNYKALNKIVVAQHSQNLSFKETSLLMNRYWSTNIVFSWRPQGDEPMEEGYENTHTLLRCWVNNKSQHPSTKREQRTDTLFADMDYIYNNMIWRLHTSIRVIFDMLHISC